VVQKKFVEENFVGILECSEINVPLKFIGFSPERLIGAERLLIQCLYLWRKQAVKTKLRPLAGAERRAFVQ
jgi:hypothetical protein